MSRLEKIKEESLKEKVMYEYKTAHMCTTCFYWEKQVTGSTGNIYQVHWGRLPEERGSGYGWTCTCKGFKYRGECRHIKEIEYNEERCAWNESGNPNLRRKKNNKGQFTCPKCGALIKVCKTVGKKWKK